MGKLSLAARNFVPNFVVAFAIASFLRDRKTGLKAGLVFGVVAVVGAILLGGRLDRVEEVAAEFEGDTETSGTETESSGAEA